jgi:hypothetical protein
MIRTRLAGGLLLALLVAAPVAADAGLRAYASVLGQRSADLDDRIDAARGLGRHYPVQGVDALAQALNDPEPAIREAALRALSAIAPAWRESVQRAASGTARAVAPASADTPGLPLMKLFDAIHADDPAPLARLVTRANVNASTRMPDGTATGDAPLDAAVSHCGLPMMDTAKLQRVFRILLDAGADPERPGRDGDTPMTRAKFQCPPEVLAVLAGG